MLAAVPLVPAMLSIVELATAMPRAGGVYYFLDRTLGPLVGTIGGIGTWLALILKVAFALIGMGAYIGLFFPSLPIVPVAVSLAIVLGVLNILGAKKTGALQVFLVLVLLSILGAFIGGGLPSLQASHFAEFWDFDVSSMVASAGLVYISYVGITKIASLSEEVKNPEKNLPLGIFLSLGAAFVVYVLGTLVMVGTLDIESLTGTLTPAADAARVFFGEFGAIILSVAALVAFVSVANAGTMSASRYPLAMSRDHIVPRWFMKMSRFDTPYISILVTVGVIVIFLVSFDPMGIAKLASAFQLFMFALVSLAVIIMRESKIQSYDPGFKAPLYPWIQIVGILASFWMIIEMGPAPMLFSSGLVVISVIWYFKYARERVVRTGAIYHIFERLGRYRYEGLDTELRGILKEKGLRDKDPFREIIARSYVMDLPEESQFENVVTQVSDWFSEHSVLKSEEIKNKFLEGNRTGATPVTHHIALPHLRIDGLKRPIMVLVRANHGLHIELNNPMKDHGMEDESVRAAFFLASPMDDPGLHLRVLAKIAGRVEDDDFPAEWQTAKSEEEIKRVLTKEEGFITFQVEREKKTGTLDDVPLFDAKFPEGCLVAMIRRTDEIIIPKGDTRLFNGDQVTVIGEPKGVEDLRKRYDLD
ncbi:MAG: amino acid permease [Ectothiorhodospiraceae bacterium]|nr:amino acid permease [Ectothiorhodospiraceae bacterium]